MDRQRQQESYTQEQLVQEEEEIINRLKKIRVMRGLNPVPQVEDFKKEEHVVDAQFRRLDPDTGQEEGVLDDLALIGFREVLSNPGDAAAQVAFLKNLKNRPDIIEKVKESVLTEEFLEKAMIAVAGGMIGFWGRGALDRKLKGFSDLL